VTLTAEQMRRAAREARKLAFEYAEGRGPALISWNYYGCVAGVLAKRAELPWPAAVSMDREVLLTLATNSQCSRDPLPGAVVFPLLWVADELDAASEQPAAGPSEAPPKESP
jgi:hypothetical protein